MRWVIASLRFLYFEGLIRPLLWLLIGLNVRHRQRLPETGPAIVVANHNSHLDTLVIMTLLGRRLLAKTQPVAAADYFLKNRWLAWFSLNIVGIIPIHRDRRGASNPLQDVDRALHSGQIVIVYPEGSRGQPEQMQAFKKGVAHLAKQHPQTPVIPLYLHGLGKALPKGEGLLVPFFCDIFVGESLFGDADVGAFMKRLQARFAELQGEADSPRWQ